MKKILVVATCLVPNLAMADVKIYQEGDMTVIDETVGMDKSKLGFNQCIVRLRNDSSHRIKDYTGAWISPIPRTTPIRTLGRGRTQCWIRECITKSRVRIRYAEDIRRPDEKYEKKLRSTVSDRDKCKDGSLWVFEDYGKYKVRVRRLK